VTARQLASASWHSVPAQTLLTQYHLVQWGQVPAPHRLFGTAALTCVKWCAGTV
jgi:hypothetical protein